MKRLWILLAIAGLLLVISQLPLLELYINHRPDVQPVGNESPQRIVSLSPQLTEILFALGLGNKVVAVSNNCNWPAEAEDKPKVGTFWQPNIEAIIAARPDLVVAEQFEQHKQVADTLRRTGLNVTGVRLEKIPELFTTIGEIGKAAGCPAQAETLAKDINEQLNAIRSRYGSGAKVRVLWVVQAEPLRVAGKSTFIDEIVGLVGGENAIGPTIQQYPAIGTEELLACGAEVIIQSAMGTQDIAGQQQDAERFWSRFKNLPAVKNKRIYVVEPDMILRLGPRLPQGAERIARYLHGEGAKQGDGDR
jgi:iron complex transport system substrate-binding protein